MVAVGFFLVRGLPPQESLFSAAFKGDTAEVGRAIDWGCPPNSPALGGGYTPLRAAVGGGHKRIIELLIFGGADVNARDADGNTPLWRAVMGNKTEVARLLIDQGADVNAKSDDGETPLLWAVRNVNQKLAELLVTRGADVNANKTKYGQTPLGEAIAVGHPEIIDLLRQHGAKE